MKVCLVLHTSAQPRAHGALPLLPITFHSLPPYEIQTQHQSSQNSLTRLWIPFLLPPKGLAPSITFLCLYFCSLFLPNTCMLLNLSLDAKSLLQHLILQKQFIPVLSVFVSLIHSSTPKQSGLCLHYLIQTAFVKIINVFHIVKSKESFLILSFGDFLVASKTVHCSFLL